MTILGLSHITFIVRDLERTSALFCSGLGASEVYDSARRAFSLSHERFLTLGGLWIAIMQGEPVERSYRHVAFAVRQEDLAHYREHLTALDVELRTPRSRVAGEGESLYFYDYDNNLFELHSGTLAQRLASYAQLTPPAIE